MSDRGTVKYEDYDEEARELFEAALNILRGNDPKLLKDTVTLTLNRREVLLYAMQNALFTSIPEEIMPDDDPVGHEVAELTAKLVRPFARGSV